MTGLSVPLFNALFERVAPKLNQVRSHSLTPKWQLLHFLFMLRHHPKHKILSSIFSISSGTSSEIKKKLLPIVYEQSSSFSSIQWPSVWTEIPIGFCGSQVLIDCTSHLRNRVHPGQQLYYRGDVGGHQLTSQIITDVKGIPIDIVIALGTHFSSHCLLFLSFLFSHFLGHNNDGGVYRLTRKKDLEELNIVCFYLIVATLITC